MRKGKRGARRSGAEKSQGYSRTSVRQDSQQRLVTIDYAKLSPLAIRELSAQRLRKWKDPRYQPSSLQNRQAFEEQWLGKRRPMSPRLRASVVEAPQSAPKQSAVAGVRALAFDFDLPRLPQNKISQAITCLKRKVRRELVFASGAGGSRRSVRNRASPSKEKC